MPQTFNAHAFEPGGSKDPPPANDGSRGGGPDTSDGEGSGRDASDRGVMNDSRDSVDQKGPSSSEVADLHARSTKSPENRERSKLATGNQKTSDLDLCEDRAQIVDMLIKVMSVQSEADKSNVVQEDPESAGVSNRSLEWSNLAYYGQIMTEFKEFIDSAAGGVGDFLSQYFEMRQGALGSGVRCQDKFHHCMANCLAAGRGPGGSWIAEVISNVREGDDLVKNIEKMGIVNATRDMNADQLANKSGRLIGRRSAGTRCTSSCQLFVVPK